MTTWPPDLVPAWIDAHDRGVVCIDTPSVELREPFLRHTHTRIGDHRRQVLVRWNELPAAHESPSPLAIIFHSGRCGSTLLARLLACHPEVVSIREPLATQRLSERVLFDHSDRATEAQRLGGVHRAIAAAYPGRHVVVKANMVEAGAAPALAGSLPSTFGIFVWGPLLTLLERSLADSFWAPALNDPSWSRLLEERQSDIRSNGQTGVSAARIWAFVHRLTSDGCALWPEDRRSTVTADELFGDPVATAIGVIERLGLDPHAPGTAAALAAGAHVDAKSRIGEPFQGREELRIVPLRHRTMLAISPNDEGRSSNHP